MTTERDDDEIQTSTDQAAEAAAFEASFEGADVELVSADASQAKQGLATPPVDAEPQATEAAPTAPSPKAEGPDVHAELRKLHGRIGSLNDQLQQALKAKETEGKPAVLSPVALSRMKSEYPELADMLEGDISDVLANLAQKTVDPKEIAAMVARQVADETFAMRKEALNDRHETWEKDCWADQPGGTRTPDYAAWLNTMTQEDAAAFENSQNPAFVIRKLDQFYDWKGKKNQATESVARTQAEKKQRLTAAITPQGTARAGPQTQSDEEALNKGFAEGFNS